MNGSFTRHCRDALAEAREQAVRLGHPFVGPEHILLGLLHLEDGIAATALQVLGLEAEVMRSAATRGLPPPEPRSPASELPYTQRATAVLKGALRGARDDGASPVHSGHVLLGTLGIEGWSRDLQIDETEMRSAVAEADRTFGRASGLRT